jgi:phosphoenolpyruvate carboxykinase (GTP)
MRWLAMEEDSIALLKKRLTDDHFQTLISIENPQLHQFVSHFIELLNPNHIFVCNDSEKDRSHIRDAAIASGEEITLAVEGQTIHFDGYSDQARDKENTKFLLPEGLDLGATINSKDKKEGLEELQAILQNIMQGHTLYIRFFCLGPTNSEFSIPAVQLTDSAYVAHSEDLLYRPGYEEFKRTGATKRFFRFVHSEGKLKESVSANIDKRRVYIDIEDDIVYSVNTQYGGNALGLKKLAMRLAIKWASKEGWLTEHMFIMGVHGPHDRTTYFAGAFPSLCGKTSTSMMKGEAIIGDDIAYLRKRGEEVRAVNVERGMFGIIQGINSADDPILWDVLHRPGEIIFSNVLMTDDGRCHWIGKDGEVPPEGVNHSGRWQPGKRDAKGQEIQPSHPNARFTLDLHLLENLDTAIDNPEGVVLRGMIYGGRDSDTWVPVEESFNWEHGIITKGASLESETTAATLGKEGVRKWNPMSNLDFLSIPVGQYIANNIAFGEGLKNPPRIFSVNYFLKDDAGNFLNEKADKAVWLKWMELRSHGEVDAIQTPTGFMPQYQDLKKLFKETLDRDYTKEAYNKQFTVRIPEGLAKIERVTQVYKNIADTPKEVFTVLQEQRERLEAAREKYGDYILPERL